MILSFPCFVDANGRPDYDINAVQHWLKEHANKHIVISFAEVAKPGSYNAQKYYFAVVLPAAIDAIRETGTVSTKDELHTAFKALFAPREPDGTIVGMSRMTSAQQHQYIEDVIHNITTELGGYIRPPTGEDQ
jgi:hypothetical protein